MGSYSACIAPGSASLKLTRMRRITEIRDAAVARAMREGSWHRIRCCRAPNGELPSFRFEGGGFTIALRTPFEKRHAPLELLKYFAALREQGVATPRVALPWQMDIWPGVGMNTRGKVLNIEWDDYGTCWITSFRRGPWEDEILQWRTANV